MEIQVQKLRELFDLLKPVVPKKPTITSIAYINVGNGKAIATDLETWVTADLPEATEPMLLPFADLADALKYIPGEATLKIECQKKTISVAWDGGNASYPSEAYQEFPPLPDMAARAEASVDGDALISAMMVAARYAAAETDRPTLHGVALKLGNPLEVAAGDGFRMSHQVLGLTFPVETDIVVPTEAVEILVHVFTKTPRTPPANATSLITVLTAKRMVRMALLGGEDKSYQKVLMDFGRASAVVNLVQGQPPAYLQLIPKGEPVLQSQLFAPQLEAAVRRVAGIAKDGSGIVRMEFADGKLTVSARREEKNISATVDTLNTQGGPSKIAFNAKYLLDYLSRKQGIIIFSRYTDTGPAVFEYQKSPRVLIMPMHVQWDGDPATEKPPAAAPPDTNPEATPKTKKPRRKAVKVPVTAGPTPAEEGAGTEPAAGEAGEPPVDKVDSPDEGQTEEEAEAEELEKVDD